MPQDRAAADPVADLLRAGEASTVDEAEELYLERHLGEVVSLVRSALPEDAFRRQLLVTLLLARGSRGFEDSLR